MSVEDRDVVPMLKKTLLLIAVGVFGFPQSLVVAAENVLTLATTTSTENSGLLAQIHPDFTAQTGIAVKVIAKGTGASLQLGRDGNADVVLVHAPDLEDKFVADGFGVLRRQIMHNDFVLLGPRSDPAGVGRVASVAEAFRRIATVGSTFISRGDGSGTHSKEQDLWRKTGLALEVQTTTAIDEGKPKSFQSLRPTGNWYLSIGQGMGKTLLVANEKQAYTLTDRGTYYAFALVEPAKIDLAILAEGHVELHNPYGVIAVNPAKHPHVNFAAAKQYVEWIASPAVQRMIGAYRVQGKVLFYPDLLPTTK